MTLTYMVLQRSRRTRTPTLRTSSWNWRSLISLARVHDSIHSKLSFMRRALFGRFSNLFVKDLSASSTLKIRKSTTFMLARQSIAAIGISEVRVYRQRDL